MSGSTIPLNVWAPHFQELLCISVPSLEGTFTAGPWIHLCFPEDKASIFMKGRHRDISLHYLNQGAHGVTSVHLPRHVTTRQCCMTIDMWYISIKAIVYRLCKTSRSSMGGERQKNGVKKVKFEITDLESSIPNCVETMPSYYE